MISKTKKEALIEMLRDWAIGEGLNLHYSVKPDRLDVWFDDYIRGCVYDVRWDQCENVFVVLKKFIEAIESDAVKAASTMSDGIRRGYILAARGTGKSVYSFRRLMKDLGLLNTTTFEKVIFNNPATIVFWADGTKTVVKCGEGDTYDPEKGMAMAISKRVLGTNASGSNYLEEFKKWLPKET